MSNRMCESAYIEKCGIARWPNYLRSLATEFEFNDVQHYAIIDQIDTLYSLIDDSSSDSELLCEKICWLQNTISDVIVHDSVVGFQLMMRATARNMLGKIYVNPRLLDLDCACNQLDYFTIDAQWFVHSGEKSDLMSTAILGASWQMPDCFANLMLTKKDDSELALTYLVVFNFSDSVINNLQITFTDKDGAIMDRLTEEDTYIDESDTCTKIMALPPYVVMENLANDGSITISFENKHETVKLIGFPHVYFMEQIKECPRLKEVLKQALSD